MPPFVILCMILGRVDCLSYPDKVVFRDGVEPHGTVSGLKQGSVPLDNPRKSAILSQNRERSLLEVLS